MYADFVQLKWLSNQSRMVIVPVTFYPLRFTKITIDLEPCMTMLLEKLRKRDRSLTDCCLCLQHIFKDEPWLLWVSGETRWDARNSQAYRSNVPSVNSAHISTYREATQTLLT